MSFALLNPTRHDVYSFIDPRHNLKGAATGKVVLVTGAGTGIGKAIAEAFALAGASHLILAARRTERLEKTKSSILQMLPECEVAVFGGIDVSDQVSVDKLMDSLPSPPDVLISNAGVASTGTVADSDPATWWRQLEVNLRGPQLVARAYIRSVRAADKRGGRIINVSSNASWRCIPERSAYTASKIALNSLSEYIDLEERDAESGVRCVAMHPGGVLDTDMTSGPDVSEELRRILIDKAELPGATAVYLSLERADFLMGRFVSATWDMEELEKVQDRVVMEDLLKSRVVGVA